MVGLYIILSKVEYQTSLFLKSRGWIHHKTINFSCLHPLGHAHFWLLWQSLFRNPPFSWSHQSPTFSVHWLLSLQPTLRTPRSLLHEMNMVNPNRGPSPSFSLHSAEQFSSPVLTSAFQITPQTLPLLTATFAVVILSPNAELVAVRMCILTHTFQLD